MMRIVFIGMLFFLLFSCGINNYSSFSFVPIPMGQDTIRLIEFKSDSLSKSVYLNVHEDEVTSIEVLKRFSKKENINFFYLNHSGERRVVFHAQGREYSIDPNRIYTDTGRRKTMDDGGHFSPLGNIITTQLTDEVTTRIRDKDWVITLHNNTPDNYSILSYLPGGDEERNTGRVFVNPKMDPDDFIYTTSEDLYSKLEASNINVILQARNDFVDDGSLSIYCGIHEQAYVNIETEHGHLKQQLRLLRLISKLIKE